MDKKTLTPLQIRVPQSLIAKLAELKAHGFNVSSVLREAAARGVDEKLEKIKKAGL